MNPASAQQSNSRAMRMSAVPETTERRLVLGAFGLVVALQVYLVFAKSLNWDELLHFGQMFDLRAGRLTFQLQTLQLYVLRWIPDVADGLMAQLRLARLTMLVFEGIAATALIGLARRFTSDRLALFTGLAWLAGGYVFLHGFSVRSDPIATAFLMTALWLLATQRLGLVTMLAIGALIGLAGMTTIKSILYLPAFAGLAWLRFCEGGKRPAVAVAIIAVPVVALMSFYLVFAWHGAGIGRPDANIFKTLAAQSVWFDKPLFFRIEYAMVQALYAPVLTLAILVAPFALARSKAPSPLRVAQIGLLAPLISLSFYQNAHPYFFVFLLAPVAAGAAPGIEALVKRYGAKPFLALVLFTPLALSATEPRAMMARQEALFTDVKRLFPEPVPYLAYTNTIPDYPRVVPFLVFGVGLDGYRNRGRPQIAEAVERGDIHFVLSDVPEIEVALEGGHAGKGLLPADEAALHANFLRLSGPIWLPGKRVCPAGSGDTLSVIRPGLYTLDGPPVAIDGQPIASGETIALTRGEHSVATSSKSCTNLWAGVSIPRASGTDYGDRIYTHF